MKGMQIEILGLKLYTVIKYFMLFLLIVFLMKNQLSKLISKNVINAFLLYSVVACGLIVIFQYARFFINHKSN